MNNSAAKSVLILLILAFVRTGYSQVNANLERDSIQIVMTIEEFYDWYLSAIEERYNTDYKPVFTEDENGFVALDFKTYIKMLKKYKVSKELLNIELASYNECLDNLKGIKYSIFKTDFTDLDHIEEVQCDFGNSFRWIGGQEPVEGIAIKTVAFQGNTNALVAIDYFYTDQENVRKYYGGNEIAMVKIKGDWSINEVESRKQ